MNLLFKRPLIACSLAGEFCPVHEPCTTCAEFFNAMPWWKRAYYTLCQRNNTRRRNRK